MTTIFIIFMLVILVIALSLSLIIAIHGRGGKVDDSQYLDSDGDHLYYDRSTIEKKKFKEHHPEVRDVRTLHRLFRHNK